MTPRSLSYVQLGSHLHLLAAVALTQPTIEQLTEEALDGDAYDFFEFADRHYWPLAPGLVRVSSTEAVELGIPTRSLRGWSGSPMDHEWQWVDRRCLKRYRRRAGRRK